MKITYRTQNISATGRTMRFLVLSMFVVLLGGLLTFIWQEHHQQVSHAASDSIVGPPSLSAAAVDALFTSLGSPMAGTGQTVLAASRSTHIDDAFALGVWWAETNDGMAGVGLGNRNPGGVQASPSYPSNGYAAYPSYAAAETDWFNIVQSRYISRDLTSVYTICYPYVGTSGALNWANKVMSYMSSYRASSPPPAPAVVIDRPIPTTAIEIKPKVETKTINPHKAVTPLKKAQQQKITLSLTTPKVPVKVSRTQNMPQSVQILFIGLGLLVALLLAVPGLLVRRKPLTARQARQEIIASSMSGLALQEQATQDLSVTTALGIGAISMQQLKPTYINQYSPVLENVSVDMINPVNAINTDQLPFEFNTLAFSPIPASPSSLQHTLQPEPVVVGGRRVPPTPLQRIPSTPLFQGVPATPVLLRSSQGGLLTRYSQQSKPRRIELTRSSGTTASHQIVSPYRGAESQSQSQTKTLHWQ